MNLQKFYILVGIDEGHLVLPEPKWIYQNFDEAYQGAARHLKMYPQDYLYIMEAVGTVTGEVSITFTRTVQEGDVEDDCPF